MDIESLPEASRAVIEQHLIKLEVDLNPATHLSFDAMEQWRDKMRIIIWTAFQHDHPELFGND